MKQLEKCLKSRQGTTLVEMLVTLTLITVMVGMAATTLSAAFKIFLRVQKEQYAQSVLDTTMTELRSLTKEATQYVKIYGNDASPEGQGGSGQWSGSGICQYRRICSSGQYGRLRSHQSVPGRDADGSN